MRMKIGNRDWNVLVVNRDEIDGCDGRTIPNDLTIKIANDLRAETTITTFIHEVVHATLDSQGRCYQKKFDLEDMCEFIAWQFFEIERLAKEFVEEVLNHE